MKISIKGQKLRRVVVIERLLRKVNGWKGVEDGSVSGKRDGLCRKEK